MEASDVAEEESSFAAVLETFLERAVPKRDELLQRSEVRHNASYVMIRGTVARAGSSCQ